MAEAVFRKAALERLSTPEQLDQALHVARPLSWLALAALLAVVTGAAIASVLVTAPVRVSGDGIILSPGGIREVVATTEGRLKEYLVRRGDAIEEGRVVALVEQPDLEQDLDLARRELAQLDRQRERVATFHERDSAVRRDLHARRRAQLQQAIVDLEQQRTWLLERARNEEELLRKQFLNRQKLLDTRIEVSRVERSITEIRSSLQQLEVERTTAELARDRELLELDLRRDDVRRKIAALEQALERRSRIVSPYAGTVTEFRTGAGEVVSRGSPLFSLLPADAPPAPDDANLLAVIYVPAGQGKKIRPGMPVLVEPATVKREEFGAIEGRVQSVAAAPSSLEGMRQTLKNTRLVDALAAGGPPLEVRVELLRDETSPSGLKWTSRGPDAPIDAGTLARADVIVRRVRLIKLLIPSLDADAPGEGG